MKKRSIIVHWLLDYASFTRGLLRGYFYNSAPPHYLNPQKTKKAPIILLSGLAERWGFVKPLGDFLAQKGYHVYIVPELKSNFKPISESATLVRAVIDKNNLKNVIIIGHSKGGTIGQYMLIHHNQDDRIRGVIAISTPFAGTALCKIIPHRAYTELTPTAELIQSLQKNKKYNHNIISIAPSWDNHIWPQNGSHLEGAENIRLTVTGHHRVLNSKELQQTLLHSIEKLAKKQV